MASSLSQVLVATVLLITTLRLYIACLLQSHMHMLEEAGRYGTDHNPLIWHVAYKTLKHAPTPPSATTGARVRYARQNAEAYQVSLDSDLQQNFIPLTRNKLDIDLWLNR